ncbi:MAG: S46 family peptidase [Bacteroidetes bacterium]|nr:S46 family peptidase [Bacteroidota bacterium]
MKKLFLLMLMVIAMSFGSFASDPPDEGMWLPMFVDRLNYTDMQKMGLKLTAEEIYSINNSSLKDAIVDFGHFCTASVVSPDGLLFTNHHCGYDAIQKHSSVDHDYLTDGFWAMTREEELPNEGLTATFLIRMEDVTARVLADVKDDMTENERNDTINKVTTTLEEEASEDGKYDVEVNSFFNGNEYYLFVYLTYKDVRLVGAPPSSIGKFGGDTDNWMWPRHTGDFSIFRIYTAPDGSPATYSKENVPLKAKYVVPVSVKGYQKEDFAMVWGFPGQTDRYRSSYGVDLTLYHSDPAIIDFGKVFLDIMKADMDASPEVRIQYASTHAQIANFWKNKVGEARDLKRLKVIDQKKAIEEQFQTWVNADPARKEKYGSVLQDMEEGYKTLADTKSQEALWYFQAPFFASKIITFPLQLRSLQAVLEKKDYQPADLEEFKVQAEEYFKDYNAALEQKLFAAALKLIYDKVPADKHPDIYTSLIMKKYKGCFDAFAADVFKKSIFATKENFMTFINKPSLKKFQNDLANKTTQSFFTAFSTLNAGTGSISEKLSRDKRLFVAGLREMMKDKVFYPDANSTMRFTYGKVLDYYPADAVHYNYMTYLSGVIEKEDPTNEEFIVPAKLKDLYQARDYGRYGKDGKMVVCFLTDNDITGGNSGSPVLNGNGELIGLAFDGNWESMSGNIAFEPALQRCINVDIRYVLFIIDKFAGAQNIINELTIR